MRLKEIRDKFIGENYSSNALIVNLLILIVSLILATLQTLSFFGIQRANDLLNTIYSITNIYKSFNVDLKILVWSAINMGFTYYLYKSLKSIPEYSQKNNESTSPIEAMNTQLKLKEADVASPKTEPDSKLLQKINELNSEIEAVKKQLKLKEADIASPKTDSDSKSSEDNDLTAKIYETAAKIQTLLQKYGIPSFFQVNHVRRPFVRLYIRCTKPNSYALIPVKAAKDITNLSAITGLEIEYDKNVKINESLTASVIEYQLLTDKSFSKMEYNEKMENAKKEIFKLFIEEKENQRHFNIRPDNDPLKNKITVQGDAFNKLPQEFIDKLKSLESKLGINIEIKINS